MNELSFRVPGVPRPQGSMTISPYGRMHHKPELLAWRRQVLSAALKAAQASSDGWGTRVMRGTGSGYDGPVGIEVSFLLPAPKRRRWWLPAVKPDLDKLCRAVLDALSPKTGVRLLREDSRVVALHATKVYADPGEESAHITIWQVPEKGVGRG